MVSKQIVPLPIGCDNQSNLPGARPVFDVMFALDGVGHRLEFLEVDEPFESILFRKAFDEAGPMLEYPADKIVRSSRRHRERRSAD